MSSLVIVAIPAKDDYVWKISSEKVPHLTILFLGEATENPNVIKIQEFVEHAASTMLNPFWLDVSDRGVLGDDEADVLFFQDDWGLPRVRSFRAALLKDPNIKKAYDSAEQFPEWNPHLTLGYPKAPAKEDPRDYPGIHSVRFDRIALWYGDSEGPEFKLKHPKYYDDLAVMAMSDSGQEAVESILSHYGVKGMKWGVRRAEKKAARAQKKLDKSDARYEKAAGDLRTKINIHNRAAELANSLDIDRINNKPEYKDVDFTKLKDDDPLLLKYETEHHSAYMARVRQAAAEVPTNASGTKRVDVEEAPEFLGWRVVTKKVDR